MRFRYLSILALAMAASVAPEAHAQVPDTPLVAHGDDWRYRKGTSEPAADWHSVADAALDATWLTGPGGFGYGDGDDGTELTDMGGAYLTVYARMSFEITAGMDPNRRLRLTVDYDDGCIVYLGGREVYRSSNLPGAPGTVYAHDADELAAGHEASAGQGGNPPEVVDLGALGVTLGPGTHVLAVQGINHTIDSSDLSLIVDLDLVDPPMDVTWTLAESPVLLTTDFVIDPTATLTIEAGVEVVLSAGVSILGGEGSHIDIAGTAASPVVLRSEGEDDWDEMSVTGAGASLAIRRADIAGGRVRILDGAFGLIEDTHIHDSGASAIVNAVGATAVTMRRCRVSNYGETLFRNTFTVLEYCLFEGTRADAVDFDAAVPGSTIRQCSFRTGLGSNTDAIDIGPTGGVPSRDVIIEDCIMHNFGDKGVSVGDGPDDAENTIIRNCLIHDVVRGIQVKHASTVIVHDCTIADSGIGLHGFDKGNFGGGGIFTRTYNNVLARNDSPITTEADTTITVEYSNTQGAAAPWPGVGNIVTDPLFRDATQRDYRLLPGSPCLGTGENGEDMGVEFPVGGLPHVPGAFQLISFDGSEAVLSWTDPDNLEDRFEVERSSDAVHWSPAATTAADATGATITGLSGNAIWFFRVRGANFIGATVRSNLVATAASPSDLDGDGLPNDYENMFPGLDPNDPTDAVLDLDFDGASFLQEFLAGTDPTDGSSVFRIEEVREPVPGTVHIQFTAQANKSYTVQYSTTLDPGSWLKLVDVVADPAQRPAHFVTDTPPAAERFRAYRLVTPMTP